ncbi:hypothetical protein RND81_09G073000 [Saponaria officinalis]|uniref:Uncharacterized protein n=1 Tax=Saponaria officinalis TaxID=3572 RepID=A0AAW1IIP6_SAPOF
MGVASSKLEDDKALQLCRERKKFVRQALDGRCALAAAHVAYIHSLKTTGTALRKFVQPDAPVESSLYTSTSATPEPLALTEKSYSRFSFSSPSASQNVEPNEHLSPSPSPPTSGHFQVHHMKFKGSFSRKVEERPPAVVTGTITSLSVSHNTTSQFHEQAEPSPSEPPIDPPETPTQQPETPPWDYFGLFHPIDNHLSSHEQREVDYDFRKYDDLKHTKEDEDVPELGDEEDKISSLPSQGSESEDEFDDPSSDTLVRSFKNLNREESNPVTDASPTARTAATPASMECENELPNEDKASSPKLSPLKTKSSEETVTTNAKVPPTNDDDDEHKITPKDFFSSVRDVEHLFIKASDSGKEVPRMLEANKLHFRPLLPGKESGGSSTASLLKACFSCGEDPSQIQEPAQASVKYITWHRAASLHSSSSRNPLDSNSRDDIEDYTGDLFENSYKISGSHASTLDRLFAWEKKLYDEVKASQLIRKDYDLKCKLLREQESRCESQHKIDKTRAVVKDLHSRVRVAIHRIDSISRKIEEMRDQELQPQLEELIDGLKRMWEVMYECHKLQRRIIGISFSNGNAKLFLQSESRRHITVNLQAELSNLSLSFTKWSNAIKMYVQAINDWLHKCVSVQEKSSKKRRWAAPLQLRLRNAGPPIYTTCGVWLDSLKELPVKSVADVIKDLALQTARFIPRLEKAHGKKTYEKLDPELEMLTPHNAYEEWNTGYDNFQSNLVAFLKEIEMFAKHSVKMYAELQNDIKEAKRTYERKMSQP